VTKYDFHWDEIDDAQKAIYEAGEDLFVIQCDLFLDPTSKLELSETQ
jgi:hypothetical protein